MFGKLAAGACLVGATLVAPGLTGTASADPGNCGVRNDNFFSSGYEIYVVRNKCASRLRVHIYLPVGRRYTEGGCQYVDGHGYGYFSSRWIDSGWQIRNC